MCEKCKKTRKIHGSVSSLVNSIMDFGKKRADIVREELKQTNETVKKFNSINNN